MQTIHQPSTLFYTTIAIISLVAITLFINWLSWPIAAGIPLGGSLFIQAMYISRKAYEFWVQFKEKEMSLDVLQNMQNRIEPAESNANGDF